MSYRSVAGILGIGKRDSGVDEPRTQPRTKMAHGIVLRGNSCDKALSRLDVGEAYRQAAVACEE